MAQREATSSGSFEERSSSEIKVNKKKKLINRNI